MNDYMISQRFKRFQEVLLSDDVITFQTFSDNADNKDISLTCQLHGRFDDVQDNLHALNNRGAGIYFTANKTDGKGRKRENITAVRSLFVDFDIPDSERVARLMALDLPPTLIVESSKDKHHAYWVADGIALDNFTACQKQLISFFTAQGDAPDKAIHDLARVMRLPGFIHQKTKNGVTTDAFTSRVVYVGKRYDKADLMAWLATMDVVVEQNTSLFQASQKTSYTHTGSASDYVRQQANGRWQYILARLGYDVGDGRHKPCPHCGGRDRFRFDNHNIKAGDGGWICSQGMGETAGGDGLSFLMDHVGMQPKDALNAVADALGVDLPDERDSVNIDEFISNSQKTDETEADSEPVIPVLENYKTRQTPSELFHLPINPKIDRELTEFIQSHNEQAPAEMILIAKLAILNTLAGRRYLSESNNPTTMNYMVLAGTGAGKNIIRNSIEALLRACNFDHLLSGSGSTSSSAVISSLMTAPNQIQIIDEFGQALKAARASNNNFAKESYAALMEVYGNYNSSIRAKNYSNLGDKKKREQTEPPVEVLCPHITLVTMATPMQVINAINTEDLENGFLNRFTVVYVNDKEMSDDDLDNFCITRQKMPKTPSMQLINFCQALRNGDTGNLSGYTIDVYNERPEFKIINWHAEAEDYVNEYYRTIKRQQKDSQDEIYNALAQRRVEQMMRLATTLAAADSVSKDTPPVTEPKHVIYAIGFIEYFGLMAHEFFRENLSDNQFTQLRQIILDSLLGIKNKADAERGLTMRELGRMNALFAKTPLHFRAPVIQTMLADGDLLYVEIKAKFGRGGSRARNAFILPQHFNESAMKPIAFKY